MLDNILASIYVRRDSHENGMTLQEYADAVIAGTQPVLEHDQFVYQFGAIQDEIDLVINWAQANGLTVVESHQGMAVVKVIGSADQYNSLFGITLCEETIDNRTYVTHFESLTVPSEINDVVQSVLGLDNTPYFVPSAIEVEAIDPNQLDPNLITPTTQDLTRVYKFPGTPRDYQKQGKSCVVGFISLSGGYTTNNLTSAFTYNKIYTNPEIVTVQVDGGGGDVNNDPSGGNPENMLDIICIGCGIPAGKIVMYSAPNSFSSFVNAVSACANDTTNRPSVLSISWGTYDTTFASYGVLTTMDTAFQSCLVKGITPVAASGDFGVRAINGGGTYTLNHPSTSPYVLAAGGSVVSVNNDYSIASEQPWGTAGGSYAAGGGVSTIYPVPSWQTGLTSKLYPSGTVSALTGRGTPDFSMMATGYVVYYGPSNSSGNFVGTSATAPLMAGLIARINELTGVRMGLPMPVWYAQGTNAFNDLTTGDNHGGNTVGYQANAGWDCASGLGTPIGTEIYKIYKKGSGSIFPKLNENRRPSSGQVYPRRLTIYTNR